MIWGGQRARHPRLHTYLAGLVGLFVVAAAAGAVIVRAQAVHQAHHDTSAQATIAAVGASGALGSAVDALQSSAEGLAANPGLGQLVSQPGACQLQYSSSDPFGSGHIDILDSEGAVVCSSLGAASAGFNYRSASWLARARSAPAILGPLPDPAAGNRPALIMSAPFPQGVVAMVVDLGPVGPGLARQFGGLGHAVILVADRSGTVVARSVSPQRWIGRSLTGTPFARYAPSSDHPDLEGVSRIYSSRVIPSLGWRVYVGIDRAAAMSGANDLFYRELAIIAAALLLLIGAAYVVQRQIAAPIRRLTRSAASVKPGGSLGSLPATGPAEVVELAAGFNRLFIDVENELESRRAAERSATSAAESLVESERRYRLLFESNPLPMWIFDSDTREFLEVNQAALEHYGYTREQFLSMRIEQIRPARDVPALLLSVQESRDEVMDRSGPWTHLRSDGGEIEVEITSHSVDFAGRRARLVMAADVTDREQVRRRLARSERLESLGQLAGSVAHDFNNLLAVMLNYSHFVKEELDKAADGDSTRWAAVRDDFDQVVRAMNQATGVTDQLLAFGRRERATPRPLDLNQVLADNEELLQRSVGAGIEVAIAAGAGLWPVMADPTRIAQVLVNLVVNARDAMPSGGRISISTSNLDVDETHVALRPGAEPGHYVQLKVSDTGTGMEPSVLQHVFEPFFTTKTSGQGTGLGLASVYGIVTQAGGDVQVYSEPGHGTTVSILLPATDLPERVTVAAPESPPSSAAGETILVADDDDGIRQITCRILARNGYKVIAAADGPTAVQVASLHEEPIDLLLTDVVMPGMLGSEVATRITELRPEIRVLFMSGNAPLSSDVLAKPFSEPVLLTKVRMTLDREEAGASP